VALDVRDEDGNGVEDWRDQYFSNNTTIRSLGTTSTTYEPPSTLTGQIGTEFIQNIIENRIYGAPGGSDEQLIASTIQELEAETSDFLYDTQDVSIITDWEEEDIRAYANVMGASITNNDLGNREGELEILRDILSRDQTERVRELEQIAVYYETVRDEAINTPVPAILAKEHLDLINTYHAVAIDISAMAQVTEDPIRSLMRVRKHSDNSLGLQLALDNMYRALVPYSSLFTTEDPAVVFALFINRQRI
jgi:hypothetical protein